MAMKFIYQGTCSTDKERKEELAELETIFDRKEILNLLRDMLTVLNSKSASLLTFNAMALASISIWASNTAIDQDTLLSLFHLCLDLIYILLLISSVICLFNVFVYWFSDSPLSDGEIVKYLQERDNRTIKHRWSLVVSLVAIGFLIVLSLLHITMVAAYGFGLCETAGSVLSKATARPPA